MACKHSSLWSSESVWRGLREADTTKQALDTIVCSLCNPLLIPLFPQPKTTAVERLWLNERKLICLRSRSMRVGMSKTKRWTDCQYRKEPTSILIISTCTDSKIFDGCRSARPVSACKRLEDHQHPMSNYVDSFLTTTLLNTDTTCWQPTKLDKTAGTIQWFWDRHNWKNIQGQAAKRTKISRSERTM